MFKRRVSLSALIALGVLGPDAAWSAPDDAAPAAAALSAPLTPSSSADLKARIRELRGRRAGLADDPEPAYRLGVLYLDLGDGAAAEEQLRSAIDLGGTQPELWPLLARAWLIEEKFADIETGIPAEVPGGASAQAAVTVARGLAWLAQGRPGAARTRFQEALTQVPDYAPAYLGLARASMAEHALPAAREALASAARGQSPEAAEVAGLRGELAAADGDLVAAEAAYREAAQAKPDQIWRLRPLAQVQIARGELDEADANLARVAEFVKGDQVTGWLAGLSALRRAHYQRAADIVAPLLGDEVQVPGLLLVAGTAAYRLGNDQEARHALEAYLRLSPNDPAARRVLAATLMRGGEPVEALAVVRPLVQGPDADHRDLVLAGMAAALAADPKTGLGYLDRATAKGAADLPLRRLTAAVRADTGDTRALEALVAEDGEGLEDVELGLLQRHLRNRDYGLVRSAAERFQGRYPDRFEGYLYEGIARVRAGEAAAARAAFERALRLSANNPDALLGLADAQLAGDDPQAALVAMDTLLSVRPRDPHVLGNLIAVGVAAGHPERAIEVLEALTAADPGDQTAAVLLAQAYRAAGRPLDALRFLEGRADAQDPPLQRERGLAEQRAGRLAAAVATFKQMAQTDPQSVAARSDLARATQEAGNADAAGRLWDAVAVLDPGNGAARIGKARAGIARLAIPFEPAALKAALGQAAEALRQDPDTAGALELRTLALILNKQPHSAVAGLTPIYARTREPLLALLLSRAYAYAEDQGAALAVLRDHVVRFPGDTQVRWELAQRYRHDRQPQAAMEQWNAILALDWGRADVHLELAAALLDAGRREQALTHLRVAEQTLPGDPRVAALKARSGR